MYDSVVLLILSCIIEIDLLKFRLLCKMPLTTDFSSFVHNCVFIFSDISLSEGEYYLMFVHWRFKNVLSWSWNLFHRILESSRLEKRPLRSSSPTANPTPPCLLNHVPKCHIYTFFEHLQGWWLNHFPGQPVLVPDHSFSKEIFPNIHLNLPWCNMRPFALVLLLITWEQRPTQYLMESFLTRRHPMRSRCSSSGQHLARSLTATSLMLALTASDTYLSLPHFCAR